MIIKCSLPSGRSVLLRVFIVKHVFILFTSFYVLIYLGSISFNFVAQNYFPPAMGNTTICYTFIQYRFNMSLNTTPHDASRIVVSVIIVCSAMYIFHHVMFFLEYVRSVRIFPSSQFSVARINSQYSLHFHVFRSLVTEHLSVCNSDLMRLQPARFNKQYAHYSLYPVFLAHSIVSFDLSFASTDLFLRVDMYYKPTTIPSTLLIKKYLDYQHFYINSFLYSHPYDCLLHVHELDSLGLAAPLPFPFLFILTYAN